MLIELTVLNMFFLIFFFFMLTRSWGYVGTLLIVELLWVLLYCLFVSIVPVVQDLSFFMTAILILTLSAVELVLGLLCFVIFYHTMNAFTVFGNSNSKVTSFYTKNYNNLKTFFKKFF